MSILAETAEVVKERLPDLESLTVERLVIGVFFTGVRLSNGAGGICYTPVKEIPQAVCCPSSAGRVFDPRRMGGMQAAAMLAGLDSREPLRTAAAVAVLNALSSACWSKKAPEYRIRTRMDALEAVDLGKEKTVAVVGALVPALQALKRRGGTCGWCPHLSW